MAEFFVKETFEERKCRKRMNNSVYFLKEIVAEP